VAEVLSRAGIEITGPDRDGESGARADRKHKAARGALDLRMPRMSGSSLPRGSPLRAHTGIILYTAYGDRALLTEALDAAHAGSSSRRPRSPRSSVPSSWFAEGRTYVDPVLAGVISGGAATDKVLNLTQRERDVLRLLADGNSNEEIGKALFISPETVRTHVRKAMMKLDADTRTQAVATALRQSLMRNALTRSEDALHAGIFLRLADYSTERESFHPRGDGTSKRPASTRGVGRPDVRSPVPPVSVARAVAGVQRGERGSEVAVEFRR